MGIENNILACTKNNIKICVSVTFDLCNTQKQTKQDKPVLKSIIKKILL